MTVGFITPKPPRGSSRDARERRLLGQYFTPPEVAAFALRSVCELAGRSLPRQPRMIDPACGEGVFLLAALAVWGAGGRPVGLDVDPSIRPRWREADLEERATVRLGDGLVDDPAAGAVPELFDLVAGNPPFGWGGMRAPGDPEARCRAVLTRYECWRLGTTWEGHAGDLADDPEARRRLERFPIELLFVERFLQLARPGGWIAIVLPDGLLANPRLQRFRDWLFDRITPRAVVSLPRTTFGGASSQTAVLIGQKKGVGCWVLGVGCWEGRGQGLPPREAETTTRMTAPPSATRVQLPTYLAEATDHLCRANTQYPIPNTRYPIPNTRFSGSVVAVRTATLRASPPVAALRGSPWSPQYWDPEVAEVLARLERTVFPVEPLGGDVLGARCSVLGPVPSATAISGPSTEHRAPSTGFLRFTTYGAVGGRTFQPSGVRYLSPRNLTPTGIDFQRCERYVAPGGPNDPPRSRLQVGDILLSNSGVASLGRPALFLEPGDYNISQHVNRIQVAGIDPCYVTAYLHTEFARAQMRRLTSGTGAAGLSYADIRALRIPILPPCDQMAIRQAFLRVHAAHSEARALKAVESGSNRGAGSLAFQAAISHARSLLEALITALEEHILAPGAGGFDAALEAGGTTLSRTKTA